MADDVRAVHAVVAGRVQGVGYRYSCMQQATALGVAGWVRNLPDGTVELWAEGPSPAVDDLLAWCHEGPAWGHVERVEADPVAPAGHTGFHVR